MTIDGNTTAIILALIGLVNIVLTAAVAKWFGSSNAKLSKEVEKVNVATNGMKDQLVKATERAALQEGTHAGMQQGRDARDDLRETVRRLEAEIGELRSEREKT